MNRLLIAGVVIAGLIAGVAAAYFATRTRTVPPVLERATLFQEPRLLPEFTLADASGHPFGPEQMRGHWTFVFFGFVNCPDICPTTLATLAATRKELGDLPAGKQPEVAFVSVDPGRDTPALLGQYVAHFDPAFIGATGTRDAIEALTHALGVAVIIGPASADGSYAVDHSAAIFLVDPQARVVALFGAPHEAGVIARDYRLVVASRDGIT
jgi:protein SCO1/2